MDHHTVFYQLSYQANLELVIFWVRNIPKEVKKLEVKYVKYHVSAALVSQRLWVQIPFKSDLSFLNCSSCVHNCMRWSSTYTSL